MKRAKRRSAMTDPKQYMAYTVSMKLPSPFQDHSLTG